MAKFIEFPLNNSASGQKNSAVVNIKSIGMIHLTTSALMTFNSIPRTAGVFMILTGIDMDQSWVEAIETAVLEASRTASPNAIITLDPKYAFSGIATI